MQILGPIESGAFAASDFRDLVRFETGIRVEPVQKALEEVAPAFAEKPRHVVARSRCLSDTIWCSFLGSLPLIASVVAAIQIPDPTAEGLHQAAPQPRHRILEMLTGDHTSVLLLLVVFVAF